MQGENPDKLGWYWLPFQRFSSSWKTRVVDWLYQQNYLTFNEENFTIKRAEKAKWAIPGIVLSFIVMCAGLY